MVILAWSRVASAVRKPVPASPMIRSAGIAQLSKYSSLVGEPLMPSLCSGAPNVNPASPFSAASTPGGGRPGSLEPPVCGTDQVRTLAWLPTQPSAQAPGGCAGPFTPAGASQSWNSEPPLGLGDRSVGAACTSISDPVTAAMKILWWTNHEASVDHVPL
jgi:hypothetical protein